MQRTVLLGFLVGALLAACGGDDRLTAEDYFERLNRIADDRATATDEIGADFEQFLRDEDPEEEVVLEAQRTLFKGLLEATETALNETEDLSPPADLKELHEEFVMGVQGVVEQLRQISDAMEAADTAEEAAESLESTFRDFEGTGDDFPRACRAMEAAASERNIEVDLDCGDDE